MLQLTKTEAIQKLEQGFGSIYTKENVLELIEAIIPDPDNSEITPQLELKVLERLQDRLHDDIYDKVTCLSNDDIVDYETASFCIDYGNRLELEQVELHWSGVSEAITDGIEYRIRDLNKEVELSEGDEDEQPNGELSTEDISE